MSFATLFMLRHDSRPYSLDWPSYPALVQHGKEAPLGATLDSQRPSVGTGSLGVILQVKDMDNAFPNRLALKRLFDWDRLGERSRTAMLGFDGALVHAPVHAANQCVQQEAGKPTGGGCFALRALQLRARP